MSDLGTVLLGVALMVIEFLWEYRGTIAVGLAVIVGLNSLRVIAWNSSGIISELSQIKETLKSNAREAKEREIL